MDAKKLVLEKHPEHPHARSFAASERWRRKFAKRHHLSKRRRSNMKNKSVEERLPQIMKFHRRLRRLMQQPSVRRPADEGAVESDNAEVLPVQKSVYGRFSLDTRINVDQVGLAFVNGLESTWDETGAKRVQISQPFAGLEKRQCTVNACFGPGAKLRRPAVVFRGKGRVPAVERAAYDPRVDVFFQSNAWMDNSTSIAWLKKSLLRSLKGEEGVVPRELSILFADNLYAQTTDEFKRVLHEECNTLMWLLPPGTTDELQPVEAGYGRLLKVEAGKELDEWLEKNDNLSQWETNALSAGKRRILLTRFIGEAIARIDARPGYRFRLFEKTGLAMTADGSLDDRITPEGVVGPYNFMDGDTSSDEDPDDNYGDGGTGGDLSSDDSISDGDGDPQDPLSQLDSDDDMDPGDGILAMQLP